MEKQYNPRVCFIIKKAIVPILLPTVLMIALSHILLVCNAQESFSGLQDEQKAYTYDATPSAGKHV